MKKNTVLLLLFLFSMCFYTCKQKQKKIAAGDFKSINTPMRVTGYLVKKSSFTENIEIPGTIIAVESTEIHPEIAGRLTYLNINEGKVVNKGTIIAQLYDGDLKAQLNKLAVQLKVQEQTTKRYEALLNINGVSKQEYEMVLLQQNNIKADIAIVESNLTRTQIRAPFTGKIGLKMVSTGAYVTPQTSLTTLSQISQLKIDFTLPEVYTSKLLPSQTVSFTTENGSKVYNAVITATETAIDEQNRSLHVRAAITNADKQLIPGTFAKVNINFAPDNNAIMIPSQAVIPQARGKKVAVLREGAVSLVDIITSTRDSNSVKVTSGLNPGDTIITTGLMGIKSGAKVMVTQVL